MTTNLPLASYTPGERTAQRRHIAIRPGDPDFLEMQLIELCNAIQRDPGVVSFLGREVEIKVMAGERGRLLRFDVRKLPGAPKVKNPLRAK